MIFANPSGAPELACNECGCRWFDRMTNTCYECGTQVPPEAVAEFQRALEGFESRRSTLTPSPSPATGEGSKVRECRAHHEGDGK